MLPLKLALDLLLVQAISMSMKDFFLSPEEIGYRNFDRCPHKQIDYFENDKHRVYAAQLVCPRSVDEGIDIIVRPQDLSENVRHERRLLLEGTRGNYVGDSYRANTYTSDDKSYDHTRHRAAKLLCGNCVFSDKSKTDVAVIRVDQAREDAEVAGLELERLQLVAQAEQSRKQIDDLKASRLHIVTEGDSTES